MHFTTLAPIARMRAYNWYRIPANPNVLESDPPGWQIWKRAQFDYELHSDESASPEPFAKNRDYNALMEIAEKVTHE